MPKLPVIYLQTPEYSQENNDVWVVLVTDDDSEVLSQKMFLSLKKAIKFAEKTKRELQKAHNARIFSNV